MADKHKQARQHLTAARWHVGQALWWLVADASLWLGEIAWRRIHVPQDVTPPREAGVPSPIWPNGRSDD